MKRLFCILPLCLLLSGCFKSFGTPFVTFEFGPLVTINVGEKNDKHEVNAYGEEAAHQAISQVTEAIHLELPASGEERKNDVQQQPDKRYKNLW